MQERAPYAQAGGAVEGGPRLAPGVEIVDAAQRVARHRHPHRRQRRDAAGHDPFAARLVHGGGARLDDDRLHPGQCRVDGGRQTGGPASRDEHVDHVVDGRSAARVSASFSQRIRTTISAAFSTVNASAVTQAVWTSGSASPSTATAT